ncbi:MAG: hypothetical protein HYZ91_05700 [Candidatus Omnitrophica bacterium]|nr:hypothetical protein [Candidatus Omnitrophota bacterium]
MPATKRLHPLTLRGPVVILAMGDYRTLLAEAGYLPTPKLTRHIVTARARFRKGNVISWEQLKRDLK